MSSIRKILSSAPLLLACFALSHLPGMAIAQTEATDSTSTGKPKTSIELVFTEYNNTSKLLSATVKTKIEDNYVTVTGIAVNFYLTEAGPDNLLGTATSNDKGVVNFEVPVDKLSKSAHDYTFVAAVENDAKFEDNQEEISVSESDFIMNLSAEDSSRQVIVTLQAPDADGNLQPVAEAEVHLYVQRLFGLLSLSAEPETTDENGEVTIDFPANIPGDTIGNLIIVAKIEEHEKYGNLVFQRKIDWGTQLVIDHNKNMRKLWSSRANAPWYLILIVNTMLIGIWGVILYIVSRVFQIRKLGQSTT